jgi:hypothetical protein
MEGFEIELKHGIILAYHGKPLFHLADMLDEIRRHATQSRTAQVYDNSSGYKVRLGRNPVNPPPIAAEWLDMVNEVAPIVDEIKRKRLGTKALHDALISLNRGVSQAPVERT